MPKAGVGKPHHQGTFFSALPSCSRPAYDSRSFRDGTGGSVTEKFRHQRSIHKVENQQINFTSLLRISPKVLWEALCALNCLSCVVPFSLCLCSRKTAPAGNDEAAIRVVVSKYVEARERIDPKAVEELFTSDADQLVSSGEWRKGRDAVVSGTMASSRNSGGKRSITVESIRMLSPDVAIADGRYELAGLAGGATRSMWTTLVLKRAGKGWRIAAIRNMLPAAPAPSR